jgi:gamma-glutamylcyclotransferase (GGCT)/AIG2-like uncharacterized protein YtfP
VESEYLFAYGTLQPGRAPDEVADLVGRFERVGEGTVAGTLYDLGAYPGAVFDPQSSRRIIGTVFRLPAGDRVLARLDDYEGFEPEAPERSLFVRRLYSVQLGEGAILRCWVYAYNGSMEHARMIESGNYSA